METAVRGEGAAEESHREVHSTSSRILLWWLYNYAVIQAPCQIGPPHLPFWRSVGAFPHLRVYEEVTEDHHPNLSDQALVPQRSYETRNKKKQSHILRQHPCKPYKALKA